MSNDRWLDEARVHSTAGRWDKAAVACRRALQASPDYADALVLLAESLERLGRPPMRPSSSSTPRRPGSPDRPSSSHVGPIFDTLVAPCRQPSTATAGLAIQPDLVDAWWGLASPRPLWRTRFPPSIAFSTSSRSSRTMAWRGTTWGSHGSSSGRSTQRSRP